MKTISLSRQSKWVLAVLCQSMFVAHIHAQPSVVSSIPANFATGVSPSAPVVFTFSEAMNPQFTSATFYNFSSGVFNTVASWNEAKTVLTCTPSPAFPANLTIQWLVYGMSALGEETDGSDVGQFSTGTGGGSTGYGTNKLTSFSVGISHNYDQAGSGAPTLDSSTPYYFMGNVVLASNRTASIVALTLPTANVMNLAQNPVAREMFYVWDSQTDPGLFNSTYPQGSYQFFIQGPTSNQTVSVTMPATSAQPPAPHINNYAAAQSVNPTQPFQLTWDNWAGGAASDYITVDISDAGYRSPDFKMPGALTGTANSFTIPANILQPDSNYTATVGFYRPTYTSNATYTTLAYRATITEFVITTTGGSASTPPIVSNPGWAAGRFGFDVASTAGQPVTVLYSSNLLAGQWYTLVTTNSPGLARIVDPRSTTNKVMFYRARNGS